MSLEFDPNLGLIAPDTEEIRNRVVQAFMSAFEKEGLPDIDTDPTTPIGQLIDALVAEVEAKDTELLWLYNEVDPSVASGRGQDALGHLYFLNRKVAEPTVATCQITGAANTQIPYGAIVRSEDNYMFINTTPVSINTDGTGEIIVRCTEFGPIPAPANSINQIVTTIAGWDTVNNETAGSLGRLVESRSEFESRRALSVAANSHGTVSAVFGTLANLDGVLDVQVLENIGPNPITKFGVEVPGHGITVCIYGGENEEIARVIYEKKDAGCDTGGNTDIVYTAADYSNAVYQYKILRPDTVPFFIKLTFSAGTVISSSLEEVIKQALISDFNGTNTDSGNARVTLASEVFASRFYNAVLSLNGVENLIRIEIAIVDDSSFSSSLMINGDQEPTIEESNITIEIGS